MYPPPPYRSQSGALSSDHSLSLTQPPIPQSAPRFSTPNSRTSLPQAPTAPYVSHGTIALTVKPYAPRKIHAFVASDPFRVFRDDDNIDITSDGLTFDDIPTAESAPRIELSQGRVSNLHGALPGQTFGGSLPNITPPPAGRYYARSSNPTQSTIYPLLNNSRAPEVPIIQMPNTVPFTSNYQVESREVPPVIVPMSFTGMRSSAAEQFTSQVYLAPPRSATESSSIVGHPEGVTISYFQKETIFTRFTRFFRFGRSVRRSHLAHSPASGSSHPSMVPVIYHDSEIKWYKCVLNIVLVTVPGQLYLLFLLRLPSLYFSRVARIFEEADMSLPEIKKMVLETALQGLTNEYDMQMAFESSSLPPSFKRLKSTWEYFIDSVMREWKTFNIISVLLLTAILTILQIESAADDPLTRYTALFSLLCSLISLLFGCMYIVRFGSMRKTYKAAEWALESQKTRMLIWWNVWVLLAMPAIWLTWSIILYIACIMSFIWRSGVTDTTPSDVSDTGLLAIRIVLTVVLGVGLLYGFLILRTFCRYGVVMDKAWQNRIDEWVQAKTKETPVSSFIQRAEDSLRSHPHSSMHPPVPTYSSGRYSPVPTYSRATNPPPSDALDTYDPGPTHRKPSIKTRTRNTDLSLSSTSGLQYEDHTTSDQDKYFSGPETTLLKDSYHIPVVKSPLPSPPLPPNIPISTAEDSENSPRLCIQKKPSLADQVAVSPRRLLPSSPKTPITSFTEFSEGGSMIPRSFRRSSVVMDQACGKRLDEWAQGKAEETLESPLILPPVVDNPQSYRYPMHYGHLPVATDSRDTYSRRSDAYTYDPTHRTPLVLNQSSKLQCDDRVSSDQDGYFSNLENSTLEGCYHIPVLRSPSLPPHMPIPSFIDQSSEGKDYAEEIQSRRKTPSLGLVSPRPLPVPPLRILKRNGEQGQLRYRPVSRVGAIFA